VTALLLIMATGVADITVTMYKQHKECLTSLLQTPLLAFK